MTKPAPGPDQPPIPVRLVTLNIRHGVGGDRPDREYGNALLSRLPVLVSDVHPLPGRGEPRSALRTLIELDGGTLWVTATHLTTRSPEERAAQIATLAGLHTDSMEAGVLVGDFNAR